MGPAAEAFQLHPLDAHLLEQAQHLEALAEWLTAEKVMLVGMESTGIYWKPVYYVLEDMFPVSDLRKSIWSRS